MASCKHTACVWRMRQKWEYCEGLHNQKVNHKVINRLDIACGVDVPMSVSGAGSLLHESRHKERLREFAVLPATCLLS